MSSATAFSFPFWRSHASRTIRQKRVHVEARSIGHRPVGRPGSRVYGELQKERQTGKARRRVANRSGRAVPRFKLNAPSRSI